MPDRISLSAIKFVGFNFRSTTISANTTYIGANNSILGKTFLVQANTVFTGANQSFDTRSSTTLHRNQVNLNGANTNVRGGTLLVTSNTNYSKTSTTLTNRGRTVLSGANTDIKGTNLYVSSNVHVSSSATFANTLVVLKGIPIRSAGGNNVTLALGDNGKFFLCTNSTSAMNIHIPINSTTAFPIGAEMIFFNQCTASAKKRLGFSKTSGVTLLSKNSANSVANTNSSASIKKVLINTWVLIGDLS